jgi:putative Ca2+/H+ antiporter (TMEM165/GDT1 family)
LLSLVLAARFRKPWPIIAGILVATLLNHAGAAWVGSWATSFLGERTLVLILGVSFLVMAAWILVPDKLDDAGVPERLAHGVFLTTAILFFIAEIGDKTQVATVMLAARYPSLMEVVLGTTLGMMIANVPVVMFGGALAARMPVATMRRIASVAFAILGVATIAMAW